MEQEFDVSSEDDYQSGGYCRIRIGDTIQEKYVIRGKLGWGHFSTVWQAETVHNEQFALKVIKSATEFYQSGVEEITMLKRVSEFEHHGTARNPLRNSNPLLEPTPSGHSHLSAHRHPSCLIRLLDHFQIASTTGTHLALAFEMLGCNLFSLIKSYEFRGVPGPLVKMIAKQLLIGLHSLHSNQIIHADLKPENVLFVKTPHLQVISNGATRRVWTREELNKAFTDPYYRVKIVDLGHARRIEELPERFDTLLQTREYRAPEVILGAKFDALIDVWSLGCVLFELLTGDVLFTSMEERSNQNEDHLRRISELLGAIPPSLVQSSTRGHVHLNIPETRTLSSSRAQGLKDLLIGKYEFGEIDADNWAHFLGRMLVVDPTKRGTALRCLGHPLIRDIDTEKFESCLDGWM